MAKTYTAGRLTPADFKTIRHGLMLSQRELARVLGYAHKIRISEFERETNPVPIPLHIQEALLALRENGGVATSWGNSVREWVRRSEA
jgi:DNA-binding transcriptional regulator YiaG